jgi:hypothetical protein
VSTTAGRLTPERIHELTPADRNRYGDLLRLGSIVVVVLGHWLIGVVLVRDGEMVATKLLAAVPSTQWLTWLFQIMPLFFFVGGYANAASWSAQAGHGTPAAVWIRRRARRLLRPVIPLVALWVPLGVVLATVGVPGDLVKLGSQVAFIPTWFLAVYLMIVTITPATWAAHERWGLRSLGGLIGAALLVDVLHHGVGVPYIGYVNFVLVWAAIHQLGYLWFEDRLPRSAGAGLAVAGAGYAALVALVTLGGYPIAMIGVEATQRSNNSPTSVALLVLGIAQVGLVIAGRGWAEPWLQRPRVWARVVAGGSVAMTVYLWHQTALVVVIALTIPTGLWPTSERVDATWWATRPVWFALCAAVLVILVRVFAHYERVGEPRARPGRLRVAVGVLATVIGLGLLLAGGLYDPDTAMGVPLTALGLLFGGLGALGVVRRTPRIQPDPGVRPPP